MYHVLTIILILQLVSTAELYDIHRGLYDYDTGNQTNTTYISDGAIKDNSSGTRCVVIGKQTFCNVTQLWKPRISSVEADFTVALPLLYAILMLTLLVLCQNNCNFGQQFRQIKVTYLANKNAIYFKKKYGKERHERIMKMSRPEQLFEIKNMELHSVRIKDFAEMEDEAQIVYLKSKRIHTDPEHLTRQERMNIMKLAGAGKNINAASLKKYRYVCGVKMPNCVRLCLMTTVVILAPILKTLWDIVDVGADCYYFHKLETGMLIDPYITRNAHVNNSILAFAVLGALKSTVIALISMRLIDYSYGSRRDSVGMCAFLKRFTVWIKIMFEDGAELCLEYFYGDKFIVLQPPWWLIFKDSVTSLIYLVPLIPSLLSLRKQYYHVKNQLGRIEALFIYLPCTVVHILFSVVMLLRVAGMSWQYFRADISPGCLGVEETSGTLRQTPFNTSCLNPLDGFMLFFGFIALVAAVFSFCNFFRSRLLGRLVRSFVFRRNFVKIYRHISNSGCTVQSNMPSEVRCENDCPNHHDNQEGA